LFGGWWEKNQIAAATKCAPAPGMLPLTAMLLLTGRFHGYYNWRLTGNPLLLPHVLNTRTYHTTVSSSGTTKKPEMPLRNQQFGEFLQRLGAQNNYDNTCPTCAR